MSKTDFCRTLHEDYPARPYQRRCNEYKFSLHLGSRKQFLADLDFLTLHGWRASDIIYVASSNCGHLLLLAQLFPNHHFTLYNSQPSKTNPELYRRANITVRETFSTATAAALAACHTRVTSSPLSAASSPRERTALENRSALLFICDYRTEGTDGSAPHDVEAMVAADMEAQQQWYLTLRPAAASLKFRLPYAAGKTRYLAGTLRLQPWAALTSCETRLFCTEFESREYDHTTYESQMFYFNSVARTAWYRHTVPPELSPGLDYCYDCTAEVDIVAAYLGSAAPGKIAEFINTISEYFGRSLDQPPHGVNPHVPLELKLSDLRSRYASSAEQEIERRVAKSPRSPSPTSPPPNIPQTKFTSARGVGARPVAVRAKKPTVQVNLPEQA